MAPAAGLPVPPCAAAEDCVGGAEDGVPRSGVGVLRGGVREGEAVEKGGVGVRGEVGSGVAVGARGVGVEEGVERMAGVGVSLMGGDGVVRGGEGEALLLALACGVCVALGVAVPGAEEDEAVAPSGALGVGMEVREGAPLALALAVLKKEAEG